MLTFPDKKNTYDSHLSWRVRHSIVVIFALLMLPLVLSIGGQNGLSPLQSSVPTLVCGLFAVLAATERIPDVLRPLLATLSLLTGGTVLIWVGEGYIGTHLAFIVLVTVATLYHDWLSYSVTLCYIWLFYVVVGDAVPQIAFHGNHGIHQINGVELALASSICSTVGMVGWVIADSALRRRRELENSLILASERQRQALEINDNVVQGLATIIYALEAGEMEIASKNASETLESAKDLIGRLLTIEGFTLSNLTNRNEPSQVNNNEK